MVNRNWVLAMVLAGVILGCSSLHADDSPAYSFTNAVTGVDQKLSLGFSFTALNDVTVDSLGYYDYTGSGFGTTHTVGIFDSNGDLLTSTTLAAGSVDPLNGSFRYHNITPLTLYPGDYVIAATTGGPSDSWAYGNANAADGNVTMAGLSVNSSISIKDNGALFVYQSDDVLRDPTDHYSNYTLYAGPNFEIAETAAPEPGSLSFVLIGVALFIIIAAWRRVREVEWR